MASNVLLTMGLQSSVSGVSVEFLRNHGHQRAAPSGRAIPASNERVEGPKGVDRQTGRQAGRRAGRQQCTLYVFIDSLILRQWPPAPLVAPSPLYALMPRFWIFLLLRRASPLSCSAG